MKRLQINAETCTGCLSCVLACSFEHEGQFSVSESRIQIEKDEQFAKNQPKVCVQCEERPCIESCPVDALSWNGRLGIVELDSEKCTGCRACVSACPYEGVIFSEKKELPLICDLCSGEPECVEACSMPEAITFREESKTGEYNDR